MIAFGRSAGVYIGMAIDPHEIPSDEDLVPPERLAKGDLIVGRNLRGKVCRAMPASLTLIKELVRRGIMAHHDEVYGVSFLELRAAFRAPWAVRSSAVLLEQWGIGVSQGKADSIYQAVCRKIEMWRCGVIEFVVEADMSRENKFHHAMYHDCFSRLVEAMDEEREKLYEERNRIG